MVVAAAATSIVSLYGNPAFADAGAEGVAADSPGIASGNNVQVPLHVPVNACGNTVNVVALLNPAFGNSCANGSGSSGTSGTSSGSSAHAEATGSPGIASGNNVQVPLHVPVNACGNTVDVVSALNPAFGNGCGSGDTSVTTTPPRTVTPPTTPPVTTPPRTVTPPTTPPVTTPPRSATPPKS
uniref:chaplin n=1 Tax=Streptomyces sp. 142MFCol3.1 TaxID=1172179 RepID=UPI00048C6392